MHTSDQLHGGAAVKAPVVRAASRILGAGMNVPERRVPNAHFATYLETSDEWISDRTGIKERRWAEPEVGASELAAPACERAVANAGLQLSDIDAVICATVTPDYTFPSTACFIQKRLGLRPGLAFDINAVCSGFVYALVTADSLIARGLCRNVLVVGVDIYSTIIDKHDRTTCVLFGDGAGAVVLSATAPEARGGSQESHFASGSGTSLRGIYSSLLGADGSQTDILCVPNGSAARPTPESTAAGQHFLRMAGKEVFKLAVRSLGDISVKLLAESGFSPDDVDYFVSHQANKRILLSMAKQLNIAEEKVLMNVEKYGNTSAASVPIVLAEFSANGTIKPGDLLLLSAFGGGVTWGACLLRW